MYSNCLDTPYHVRHIAVGTGKHLVSEVQRFRILSIDSYVYRTEYDVFHLFAHKNHESRKEISLQSADD